MGWGNAAKKAKANVNAQAERDGIKKLSGRLSDLVSQMKDPKDKQAVCQLVREIKRSIRANDKKMAINKFKKAASAAAVRLVKNAAVGAIKAMFCLAVVMLLSTSAIADDKVKGPMDALGRFIESQEAIVGLSISPLDVKNLQLEGVTLLRGPAYGEHGLSLMPGKHKPGAKAYVEIDYGGRYTEKDDEFKVNFRAMVGLHPANLTNLILQDVIRSDRLRIPELPENLVGGPMFRIPLPGDPEPWTWSNGFRLVLAYLFE